MKLIDAAQILGLFSVLLLASCGGEHEKPNFQYMPNMVYGPDNKAQEAQEGSGRLGYAGMRKPVPGTVARGMEIYPYSNEPEKAAGLRNPLPRSRAVLARGRELYDTYCTVCHGPYGEGNGSVVPKFPAPPTLQSDKVLDWLNKSQDGRIYHIITVGQNRMPSYSTQVESKDRWAIVHYLRVLQRAKNPTPEDLKRLEKW